MCTSYFIENSKDDRQMASIVRDVSRSGLAQRMREKLGRPVTTYGRVKPGDIVPVIAPDNKTGKGRVFPMVWGFTGQTQDTSSAGPGGRTVIASARFENAEKSRLFGDSWARKRCLIPASWYYEYEHLRLSTDPSAAGINGSQIRDPLTGGISGTSGTGGAGRSTGSAGAGNRPSSQSSAYGSKYMLQPAGRTNLLMAGLYRIETEPDGSRFPHFVILTRPAAEDILFIHDRMPVIIDPVYTEKDFFVNEIDMADVEETRRQGRSGRKAARTGRAKEFEGVRDVIFGSRSDPSQTETESLSYNRGEDARRSMVDDWIGPSTGAWRLQEIVGKSVTTLVYEKC